MTARLSPPQSNGASIATVPSSSSRHRERQSPLQSNGASIAYRFYSPSSIRGAGGDCLDPTAIEHRSPVLRELHQDTPGGVSIPQLSSIDRDNMTTVRQGRKAHCLDPIAIEHRSRPLHAPTLVAGLANMSRSHSHRASIATKGVRADDSSAGVSIPQPSSIDRDFQALTSNVARRLKSRSHSHRASIATPPARVRGEADGRSRFHSHRASIATINREGVLFLWVLSRFHSHRASIATEVPVTPGTPEHDGLDSTAIEHRSRPA